MLWRHADFLKRWAAETISVFGSRVTILALPLTAVLLLAATPAQMGLLVAAQTLPFRLIGLLVGTLGAPLAGLWLWWSPLSAQREP